MGSQPESPLGPLDVLPPCSSLLFELEGPARSLETLRESTDPVKQQESLSEAVSASASTSSGPRGV